MTKRLSLRARTVAVAAAATLGAGALLPLVGAKADDSAASEPGVGDAIAQTWKVDPKSGGLSIGVAFGQALAHHQNHTAIGQSQAINLGALGTSLGAPQCDGSDPTLPPKEQPDALIVSSNQDGADQGKTENEDFQGNMHGGYLPMSKYARANTTPFGESTTKTLEQPFGSALDVGAGVAHSESGIVNGVRQAKATVDIPTLNLAGVVELSNLHWEAVYRSSGDNAKTGGFTIGRAVINGTPVSTSDPSATLDQANQALASLGLKLVPGGSYKAEGVQFVDPLAIEVVPNAKRDQLAGSLYSQAVQPVQQQLFDNLYQKGSCKFANVYTIYDIVLGSMTGAGSFAVELGGVQASSAPLPPNTFHPGFASIETIGGETPPVLGNPAESVVVTGSSSAASPAVAPGAPVRHRRIITTPTPQTAAASFKRTRGGPLAVVGLVTLALLALAAEGDRRKMRRALSNQEAQQ